MGHHIKQGLSATVTANDTYDVKKWWQQQPACTRDGCDSVNFLNGLSHTNATEKSKKLAYTAVCDHCPSSYTCDIYDAGIVGYAVVRKVNKKVSCRDYDGKWRKHIKEVTETKTYKSKPTRIIKGGVLKERHLVYIGFDAHDYDGDRDCEGIV